MGIKWHIITCEYPPQLGGVSHYTKLVASSLAAATDTVHVWCPVQAQEPESTPGVTVQALGGRFHPSDLGRLGKALERFPAPRRLLVQWVPQGYGFHSMNLPFCWWLWYRARYKGDEIELMVHEAYLTFSFKSWKQSCAAAVQRLMIMTLLQAARHVWISIPTWEQRLHPYTLGRKLPITWLPVPSNIAVANDSIGVRETRVRYATGKQLLLGHFGTYGKDIKQFLLAVLPEVLHNQLNSVLLLLGRGSSAFRDKITHLYPDIAPRIQASGTLTDRDLSLHLSACDLMFQPYPDGVCSRHSSAMVNLLHGRPILTTKGRLTESLWITSEAVALVPDRDIKAIQQGLLELMTNAQERERLGKAANLFYKNYFEVNHVISKLRALDLRSPTPATATGVMKQPTD